MPGLTTLPGGLVWAPYGLSVEDRRRYQGHQPMLALELCEHAGGKPGIYKVPHYSVGATGFAFGPLGVDRLLHFCRGLDARLRHGAVVLYAPKSSPAYRLNALVLLGGYLLMKHKWTTEKLARVLHDAEAKFLCSWSWDRTREEDRVLRVRDCWAGIELATQRKWLDVGCIKDDQKLQAFMRVHRWAANFFDATWIIPGLVMVAADPVSVITDGNPTSCQKMFPKQKRSPQRSNATQSTATTSPTSPNPLGTSDEGQLAFNVPPGLVEGEAIGVRTLGRSPSLDSLATVGKDATAEFSEQDPEEVDGDVCPARDFATFFTENNVGLIIRCNWDVEEGLPKSYSDTAFHPYGMEQINIRVPDKNGSLPSPEDVRVLLQRCEEFLDPARSGQPAVLVHCKGGFGRSVTLAAVLAIYRYNLSGAAVLGWVRLARPGAITCRQQELFVKSLRGSADVAKYAKLPCDGARHPSCSDACSIQ